MIMDMILDGRSPHRLGRRLKRGVITRLLYIMRGANPRPFNILGRERRGWNEEIRSIFDTYILICVYR